MGQQLPTRGPEPRAYHPATQSTPAETAAPRVSSKPALHSPALCHLPAGGELVLTGGSPLGMGTRLHGTREEPVPPGVSRLLCPWQSDSTSRCRKAFACSFAAQDQLSVEDRLEDGDHSWNPVRGSFVVQSSARRWNTGAGTPPP